jgi:hypothetical protein
LYKYENAILLSLVIGGFLMEKIDERDGFGRNMIGNFFWILVGMVW